MNDLDRVLGRRAPIHEVTTTGDVPPVMAAPPSRFSKRPKAKDSDDSRKRRASLISGVIGMREAEEEPDKTSDEEGVIPSDAKEIDSADTNVAGINVKTPEFKKRDPDSPQDEEEQLLTPRAALVAPDVTPHSMTEIDPSDVPGQGAETFRAGDAHAPAPPPTTPPTPSGGSDKFTSAMDTLLGRDRTSQSTNQSMGHMATPPVSEQAISPEAAAAMFASRGTGGIPLDPLRRGEPMPDPVQGDGKKICEAFRKFF